MNYLPVKPWAPISCQFLVNLAAPRKSASAAARRSPCLVLGPIVPRPMVTAFYVDNGKNLPPWREFPQRAFRVLPAGIGLPGHDARALAPTAGFSATGRQSPPVDASMSSAMTTGLKRPPHRQWVNRSALRKASRSSLAIAQAMRSGR